jgi:exosortase/archaeosortase family protein
MQRTEWTLAGRIAVFLAVFALLSAAYSSGRGTELERLAIERLTVQPAATMLDLVAPQLGVRAAGPRLTAPGGGINVLAGCEGADILFLVIAAIVAAPLGWASRLRGLLLGLGVAFAANQARLVSLFFVARESPQHFALVHGVIGPLLLVLVVAGWFGWYVRRHAAGPVALYRL